ncbi:MAG: deoxyguanosinetriphosphate triphosphohydrolase [Phycisphaerae bacterium]|nr:deoxyguanosinetriphosphate triphosphohydrolase [Phycisphaerae bacterium]
MEYLRTREQLEQGERQLLASYAVVSADSRGRRHSEAEHALRTCFQRDRDRVIHCAAFRRLEAKTQVFVSPESDYYRTRLTHTIEVAQVARTMARILGVNEDLAEAAALAHDLGHPPFGHSGEWALNELMADHGGFEHNRHSMRNVEYLEHPYPSFRGLNLTYETRECLAKHETHYDTPGPQNEYGTGLATIEGQIADLADSVAYNSHDIDDALAAGFIREEQLDELELYQDVKQQVHQQYPKAHRFARQLRSAKALIDLLARDAMTEAVARLEKLNPTSPDAIREAPEKIIALSAKRHEQLQKLQQFLYNKVYRHPDVVESQKQAGRELRFLFNYYIEKPDTLPARYLSRIKEQSLHQVVCDYIAGMTDRFCRKHYLEFSGS